MTQTTDINTATVKREELITGLYKSGFPPVAGYVSKMGGSFDDAKDIFQDALIIYYEKAVAGNITSDTNGKAYLMGIARHLWLKKFRTDKHNISLENFDTELQQQDDPTQQLSVNKIARYLEVAGKKCMELLSVFYYHKLPVKEVAGLFGYSGERSATVQKYKCLEKIRETIKEKSLVYDDFIE